MIKECILLFSLILLFTGFAFAQLFIDASSGLPNNGAMGQSMDVRAADLDEDGDLDIVLANEFQANTILINDSGGVFTNETVGNLPQRVQDSEDVAIADFNGDGHLDLVFCSEDDIDLGESNVHEYYLGDGTGSFSTASYSFPDSKANAVITAYINNDTFPDLIFGNDGQNFLLINDGSGVFQDETNDRLPFINDTTQDLILFDADGDDDEDLFVGNENGNRLLINNGNGVFEDETSSRLPTGLNIETRKIAFGDIDGDEDLDIFLSNVAFIPGKDPRNRLFENDGSGFFTDVTSSKLPFDNDLTIDAIFMDVNQDQTLDLVIGNVFNSTPIRIYTNDGLGIFQNMTLDILGTNYIRDALGIFSADFNSDQSPDLYICDRNTGSGSKDLLLLNTQELVSSNQSVSLPAEEVQVFPNPTSKQLQLQYPKNFGPISEVAIFDNSGKQLANPSFNKLQTESNLKLRLADLAPGIYWLKLSFKEGSITKKVILQ